MKQEPNPIDPWAIEGGRATPRDLPNPLADRLTAEVMAVLDEDEETSPHDVEASSQ